MFKRVVNVVEVLALLGALAFVIALFANEPSGSTVKSGPGYDLFIANCATCHGQNAEGGVGPKLAGGAVVKAFPNADDQVKLVERGRGSMPAFKGRLGDREIRDVVEYTRSLK